MSDRPSDDGGSARSDAASRLAALLADVVDGAPPAAPTPSASSSSSGGEAPRRVVRRRDLVEPADPDATQPISVVGGLPAPPSPSSSDEDAAAARQREREEEVLAEARAFVRSGAGQPPAVLKKQPGKPWSRSAPAAPPPAAAPTPPRGRTDDAPAAPRGHADDVQAPAAAAAAPVAPAAPPRRPADDALAAPVSSGTDAAAAPPGRPAADGTAAASAQSGRAADTVETAPPATPPVPPRRRPAADATPSLAKVAAAPPPPDEPDGDHATDGDGLRARAPRVTLRAVAFGLALALLMGAVPVLGWVGSQRLLDSKGGQVVEGGTDETEPGYRALVTPTSTALVVHRDAEGTPVSATILSLGAGEAGGTVILVPLGLEPVEGSYFHTIIDGWSSADSDDGFRRAIEDVIGISVPPPLIDVTDESLATLMAPVAPLELDVTDPVTLEDGTPLDGPVSLAAEQVGPFLRATREGEPEIAHLERNRDVWAAWLEAISTSTVPEPIGAAATGMGTFLRTLAAGEPVVETLEVEQVEDYLQGPSYVPAAGMNQQIIDAVPFPLPPREGRRFLVELLNGSEGASLPMPLMRDLILAGGSVVSVGNADELGQEGSTILYKDEELEGIAETLVGLLGGDVEVEQMSSQRADVSDEDMVITIGSDAISRYEEQEDGGG